MPTCPRALLALLLLSCAEPSPRPTYAAQPYTFEPSSGEPVAAELGEIEVPEDREQPASRRIKLRFVRFAATTPRPGSPIVYLAGGPGGSGIDSARGARFPVFMALRAIGDVIALDQRGTGLSEGDLACTERYELPLDRPLTRAALADAFGGAARQCAQRLVRSGVAVAGYNARQSAADLDDLRRALGANKLTLWGTSYGTTLALAALQRDARRVDRVILAGVEPLDQMLKLPSDQQRLLETIEQLAAGDPGLAGRGRDLVATLGRLVAQLASEPARATLIDPRNGDEIELVLGPLDLQLVVAAMLTGPETLALLPDLIARLDAGDWLALGMLAAGANTDELPSMMALATDCASGASAAWLERVAAEARTTVLGDTINAPMPEICAGLPIAVLDDAFRTNPETSVPVLAISGTLDGRTPPSGADRVVERMRNARRLILDGAGHGDDLFVASPRIVEVMLRFLRGELRADETIALPPLRFVPVRSVISLDDAARARLVGDYRAADGAVWNLVDAGNVLYLVLPDRSPLPLRASSPSELFSEGQRAVVRFELDATGRATSLRVLPDGVTAGPPATRLP